MMSDHRHRSRSGHASRHRHHHMRVDFGPSEISCCVKYSIFGFNVIFFLIGFGLLAVGVWAHYEKNTAYAHLNRISKIYFDPAIFLMFGGGLIFVIGFSGCIGALRENTCFLALYSTIIGLLLLAEIAVGVLLFMSKNWIVDDFYARLDETIPLYREDPDLQAVIDWMQIYFKCCGIRSPNDWEKNMYFNTTSVTSFSPEAGGVPYSCCTQPRSMNGPINYACGHKARMLKALPSSVYSEGCMPKVESYVTQNFTYVAIVIFIIGVVQIFGILFAQNLRSDIFAQRARWFRR